MSPIRNLKSGLAKTRARLVGGIGSLFRAGSDLSPEVFEELEDLLLEADLGAELALDIAEDARKRVAKTSKESELESVLALIRERIEAELACGTDGPSDLGRPHVILVVGVNGVGKTTTVAKLARLHQRAGRQVLLAAADTFRAAAAEQLKIWADRLGCRMVSHQPGADPSAVAFDAAHAASARAQDVLIVDTAGRFHNKQQLMDELSKIRRVLGREIDGAPHEVLLVLDANTGQNALEQSLVFKEATAVTGLVLAKLDGSARAGFVLAIGRRLGLPVRYVGLGEGIDDLDSFRPDLFAEALLTREGESQ